MSAVFNLLYLLTFVVTERKKYPAPVLWRSWTMQWSGQREQTTVISLWISWVYELSFRSLWKLPKRWKRLGLQRRNMKVSFKEYVFSGTGWKVLDAFGSDLLGSVASRFPQVDVTVYCCQFALPIQFSLIFPSALLNFSCLLGGRSDRNQRKLVWFSALYFITSGTPWMWNPSHLSVYIN